MNDNTSDTPVVQRPFRTLATGLQFPEGPVALSDGSVLLVEIAAGHLTRIAADQTRTVIAHTGGGPNGAAIGPDGRCYLCNNGGDRWESVGGLLLPVGPSADYRGGRIERVDLVTGNVEVLYERAGERSLSAPNDLVFDGHGGFWFTDLGKNQGNARQDGGIYYARTDGSAITEAVHPFMAPNGIGLSRDGRTLYVAETFTGRLIRFAIPAPGVLERGSGILAGDYLATAPGRTFLDSMALEEGGNVCVAAPLLGVVLVYAPDGTLFERVATPDPLPTNICFGGERMQTAYITLSGTGQLIAMDWPRPGLRLPHQRVADR